MRATIVLAVAIAAVAAQTTAPPSVLSIELIVATSAKPTTATRAFDVSVVGDATYSIPGPICSGAGLVPAGVKCPVKGDKAVASCHKGLKSWGANGACVAPVDAVCQKIPSGAWGCVWGTSTAKPLPTAAPTKPAGFPVTLVLVTKLPTTSVAPTIPVVTTSPPATAVVPTDIPVVTTSPPATAVVPTDIPVVTTSPPLTVMPTDIPIVTGTLTTSPPATDIPIVTGILTTAPPATDFPIVTGTLTTSPPDTMQP